MKKVFTITEAKAQFFQGYCGVSSGPRNYDTKRGVPVARLVPVEAQKGKGSLVFMRGNSRSRTTLTRPSLTRFLTRLKAKEAAPEEGMKFLLNVSAFCCGVFSQ